MVHDIITTEGIILAKRDYREANQLLVVLTPEFGKIHVIAQGVRLNKAKLKGRLTPFSYSRFSLVKASQSYRLTDVDPISFGTPLLQNLDRLELFANLATLLDRMLQGERPEPGLWQKMKGLLEYLSKNDELSEELRRLELKALFHILRDLGYVGEDEKYTKESQLREVINHAIEASQL